MGKLSKVNQYRIALLVVILAVYFFMRFVFGLLFPFFLAFLTVGGCYPVLSKIQKKCKLNPCGSLCVLAAVIVLLIAVPAALAFFCNKGVFLGLYDSCKGYFCTWQEKLNSQIFSGITTWCEGAIGGVTDVLAKVVVYVIAVILFAKDYGKIKAGIERNENNRDIYDVIKSVIRYLGIFLRTQGILFLLIGGICAVALTLAKVSWGWLFGILAGFLDALPFLGTGIVLVPLTIWQLFSENYGAAVVCLVVYLVCILIRQFLEPKLIGDRVGLLPVFMFAAIFVGLKLFGIGGIIKGPVGLLIFLEVKKKLKEKIVVEKGEKE